MVDTCWTKKPDTCILPFAMSDSVSRPWAQSRRILSSGVRIQINMPSIFRIPRVHSISLIVALGVSGMASAASFDCSKAVSATDRQICASPELQKLDEQISVLFRQHTAGSDADAWRTDQRAWLRKRDQCSDTSCLQGAYHERVTVLEHGAGPFHWQGTWWRVDASGQYGGQLGLSDLTAQGVRFHLEASAGANQGELDGKARFDSNGVAHYVSGDASQRCVLNFRRAVNRIEIEQQGDFSACGAGMGVTYDGTYVRAARAPNRKPDLVTLGIVKTGAQDRAIRSLLGSDYDVLAATAGAVNESPSESTAPGTIVVDTFVQGLACDMKAVVIYDTSAHLWVGLWSSSAKAASPKLPADVTELRYYTNNPADKQHPPKPIESRRNQVCPSEREVLRLMP
ncbi:lysozyme inhibitor LprI family protein [Paraburkholderia bannensis]|uniref:lysozyme inhibitor LprI family protein n=1 Tax=Paraburkholderia bannensis TaxID=765414 RepID=UPI0012EB8EAE|nr:lysozyme inhibitor LprI family protein [Paraburkholderia bannensis]